MGNLSLLEALKEQEMDEKMLSNNGWELDDSKEEYTCRHPDAPGLGKEGLSFPKAMAAHTDNMKAIGELAEKGWTSPLPNNPYKLRHPQIEEVNKREGMESCGVLRLPEALEAQANSEEKLREAGWEQVESSTKHEWRHNWGERLQDLPFAKALARLEINRQGIKQLTCKEGGWDRPDPKQYRLRFPGLDSDHYLSDALKVQIWYYEDMLIGKEYNLRASGFSKTDIQKHLDGFRKKTDQDSTPVFRKFKRGTRYCKKAGDNGYHPREYTTREPPKGYDDDESNVVLVRAPRKSKDGAKLIRMKRQLNLNLDGLCKGKVGKTKLHTKKECLAQEDGKNHIPGSWTTESCRRRLTARLNRMEQNF